MKAQLNLSTHVRAVGFELLIVFFEQTELRQCATDVKDEKHCSRNTAQCSTDERTHFQIACKQKVKPTHTHVFGIYQS